ncbi:E3 ubiquitin-protein ligase TRIM39-like [Microcaecilia unicolor]|uniref:E3 ubiquitin-protein ligase TRIM39-like n=1 Tax=Microcaecilia unicolor TaxID=1415580 RepID=A0A6P7XJT9_9AMPH|nr:E3 ubiquitin-protein ligase TRIM39-like [Microcaecilia unicolor]
MAAANPAESLRDEASCSICLDYFTDPVTIDCGHNFCRSCITQSWEGRDTDFPCPQCRETTQQRNLRPNRQLVNITEMVKKLSQCSVGPKEANLCEKHEEKLKLFCEEDQNLICRESRDHRSHTVSPIEEAVQEYKEKLKMHLEPLRKDLEDLLKFKSTEEKKAEELKEKLEMHLEPLRKDLEDLLKFKSTEGRKAEELKEKLKMHLEPLRKELEDLLKFKSEGKKDEDLRSETEIIRQKVESEFDELHQFLNKEKQILLSRLEEEEKKILQRMREIEMQLEEQSSSLMQLISEIEEKSHQPANELLKDVKDALSRCQKMKFPEPESVSTDLKMGFGLSYPHQLKKLITKFGGLDWWMDYHKYGVNVTLDLKTTHPRLVLSEDQKSVRQEDTRQNLLNNPERFDSFHCVLGCESFTSGKHYWEVEVGDNSGWILGVCKDSVRRKGELTLSPGEGFWTVELSYLLGYLALSSPETRLPLSERPRAMGILLDYQAGKVSFYNADNKSHLFTFTDTFTGKLRPFFSTYSKAPLKICPVPAWELNSGAQN